MSSGPTVSVIIPAYRASGTIALALESLRTQTRPPDEVLVIDDGSPDGDALADAVAPFGDFATLVRKPNGGAAGARNLGIDRARGDLISFLDADDYWEPDKLQRQLEILDQHPEVGLVAGRYYEQSAGGGPRTAKTAGADHRGFGAVNEGVVLRPTDDEVLRVATRVWTSVVLVRRPVLGEHRFVSGLEPAEDRDLWIRLIASAPVYLIPEPLATWVLVPGSLSRSNVRVDFGNMLRVVRRHAELLGRRGTRQWEATFLRLWAAGHLGQGEPLAALGPALGRVRRQPLSVEGWYVVAKCAAMAGLPARRRPGGPS